MKFTPCIKPYSKCNEVFISIWITWTPLSGWTNSSTAIPPKSSQFLGVPRK